MVQRDGDKLIVRRVVSGEEVFLNNNSSSKDQHQTQNQSQSRPSSRASYADSFKLLQGEEDLSKFGLILEDSSGKSDSGNNNNNNNNNSECPEQQLPQCKIKRNYSCSSCTYFTQNPRKYLTHLRDVHGEKIIINECKRCLYASRHYQKLVRHMKMVHGSTDGIKTPFSSRRRGTFRKEFFKKNKFKMNNHPVTSGNSIGGGGGGGVSSNPSESQYSLSSANYINQLMKSGLSKMFSAVNGSSGGSGGNVGGGDSSTENSLFFPGNFKPAGLTLAEQAQQLSSQLKGSSNINIFTDNGGTSSQLVVGGESVNNDVLAMLQHNLVDKSKQLTITPAGEMASAARAKKRARPIPDLIPLHSISQLHLTGEAGKTYHLNPEVTIKTRVASSISGSGENNNSTVDAAGKSSSAASSAFVIVDDDDSPINLTADHHQQQQPQDDKGGSGLQHQCIFCQIMVRTTDDLALHLRTFHSDELFALLLQKKPDDNGQVEQQQQQQVQQPPQLFSAETLTIDIWKRLLENNKAILEEQEARDNDSEMQSGQFSNDEDDAETVESAISKNETYCGVETAPGYGEVTSKINLDGPATPSTAIMKKVFKCPHCSFWASTASRFHVHIVGHLNKKPFECSLCAYRSNWRWDITKHIRLKTIRDPSHKNAGVLMNDETGRRNYTKYNRYITLMKVTDNSYKDASSSSKAMMLEANQAEYLAMCAKSGGDQSSGSSSSLATPNAFNSLAKMYSPEELAQAFNLANMNQMARYEPEMLQTLMGAKTLPTSDDDPPSSTPSSAPKVAFKCKKCNFKNPFREMVLHHIKSTHLSGSDKSGADAEIDLCEDQQQHHDPSATEPPALAADPSPATANNSTHQNHHPTTLSPLRTSRTSSSPGGVLVVHASPPGGGGGRRNVVSSVVADGSGSSSSGAGTPAAVANSGTNPVVGFPSNNYTNTTTTNATTLIGVGLNLTQAVVANDNRLGTTTSSFSTSSTSSCSFTLSNSNLTTTTTSSVVSCGGEAAGAGSVANTTSSPSSNTTNSTNANSTGKGTGVGAAPSSNTWRPSAPYRCGHCHQVSNWKHVIQRHCRLKHNGNVLIEMVNTASKQHQQNQQSSTTTTSTSSSVQPNQQPPPTATASQNFHRISPYSRSRCTR